MKVPYFGLVALLLSFAGSFDRASAAIDTNLSLTIRRTNQNVVVRWFASNSVPYQVESSTTFATWTSSSLVLTGSGSFLFVTNPIAANTNAFFRVKRLTFVGPVTASFDPLLGILTILGNDFDNTIVVSRNAAGTLLVNNGAIAITGGT